jgi:DNA-binding XRE family transcriptional regulator
MIVLIRIALTHEHSSCIVLSMKQWIPEEIKEFRNRYGLYQKQLANLLGVTERYIIYLEKGVRKPSKTITLFLDCLEDQMKQGKEKEKGG